GGPITRWSGVDRSAIPPKQISIQPSILNIIDQVGYTCEKVCRMWRNGMRVGRKGLAALASVVLAAGMTIGGSTAQAAERPQTAGTAAPAADALLSQGKPTTASSSGGCCAPGNAVDGKTTSRWASA